MKLKGTGDMLRVEGILAEGYGLNPKKVMRDPRLTIEAKAIYSYISSFAGAGQQAFPARGLILTELGISKDRYYKHLNLLIALDYIRIERTTEGNLYGKNIYVIVSHPDPEGMESAGKMKESDLPAEPAEKKPQTENGASSLGYKDEKQRRAVKSKFFVIEKKSIGALRNQLQIDGLKEQYPDDTVIIENIFMAAEDMATSEEITVAKSTKKKEAIDGILSRLTSDNVRVVLSILKKSKQKIYNKKAYIQACLVDSIYKVNEFDFEKENATNMREMDGQSEIEIDVAAELKKKAELYRCYPDLKEMDTEIHSLNLRLAKMALNHTEKDDLNEIQRALSKKNSEREAIMRMIKAKECS